MRFSFLAATLVAFLFSQNAFSEKNTKPKSDPAAPVATVEQKVVSGTVLLNEVNAPDFKTLIKTLNTKWKIRTDSANITDKTAVFSAGGATVMLAWLDYPASSTAIHDAAKVSLIWPTALQEAPLHKAQVVISVIGPDNRTLDWYKLMTRVAAAVLENSRAAGIYLESQYLLVSRGYFLEAARNIDESLPLTCWLYFGRWEENGKSNGYTFGLNEFGLLDMEILNSAHTPSEVLAVLQDVAQQVIEKKLRLQEGQQIQSIADKKIGVHSSKATFLEGNTLKLDF